jgi:HSP20 family protein
MSTLIKRNGFTFPSLVNDLLNSNFPDFSGDVFNWQSPRNIPSVNVTETAKEFKIEMAVPGLERKDFKVEMEDGMLKISAEKQDEKEEKGKNWLRKEFSYSQFSRSFQMPENILADKIDARYENGILRIELPKNEVTVESRKKEIAVS